VSYPVGLIDVYRNGVKLATTDFTATNGTSFTLTTAANAGDIVQAEVFNSLNLYETITADTFSGNGVQTTFIMSVSPYDSASTLVAISGVVQEPSTYTISTNTLNFSAAPPSGSNNISVRYLGVPAASAGNASYSTLTSDTGYFDLPSGTTAQRPASPATGMIRYNTTESKYEVYSGTAWQFLNTTNYPYSATYLVVAGGAGGGGAYAGGGGGAGGLRTGTSNLTVGTIYTVTVGAGGTATANTTGGNGSNSVFNSITSTGGGGGGRGQGPSGENGQSGGSGGGGGGEDGTSRTGGAGTSGQGNAGGNNTTAPNYGSGGGGGASAVGVAGTGVASGNGGAGTASSITGSSVTYAGGGGGGSSFSGPTTAGSGGAGGGGAGGGSGVNGTAGTANRGGGGGGSGASGGSGGTGGSGVVILSVPTANYSGTTTGSPTVTTSGINTIITFTASGSYTA
jgi:hypothetical protein